MREPNEVEKAVREVLEEADFSMTEEQLKRYDKLNVEGEVDLAFCESLGGCCTGIAYIEDTSKHLDKILDQVEECSS